MGKPEFDKMTVRQLAEYIVDQRIKVGYYDPKHREHDIRAFMAADREALIWNAENTDACLSASGF